MVKSQRIHINISIRYIDSKKEDCFSFETIECHYTKAIASLEDLNKKAIDTLKVIQESRE